MRKDIPDYKVEGVKVAISKDNEEIWKVHLINANDFLIKDILITSKGYEAKENKDTKKTSTLRQMIGEVKAGESVIIESIIPDVFGMNNEYWVSYYVDGNIYDKKFIFVPDSIREDNFTYIPELETEGVLHE